MIMHIVSFVLMYINHYNGKVSLVKGFVVADGSCIQNDRISL